MESSGCQQYNLKWTNYMNNILQVFSEHLTQQSLVDVTLFCEGQVIKAHKIVLSASSTYFKELFDIHNENNPVVILTGVNFNDLKLVVEFMYRGEVKVQEADIDSLLALAVSLQVKGLCAVRRAQDEASQESESLPSVQNEKKRRKSIQENVPNKKSNNNTGASQTDDFPPIGNPNPQLNSALRVSCNPCDDEKVQEKISRPPSAFMLFANEWRQKLAMQFPNRNNKEIFVRLGSMWKALPDQEKKQYYEAASAAESEHKVKYPAYLHTPKEPKVKKETKSPNKKNNKASSVEFVRIVNTESGNEEVNPCDNDEVEMLEEHVPPIDITGDP